MAGRRRTARDRRRRDLGQNFLTDHRQLRRLISSLDLGADELVIDIGAGAGALTVAMAAAGAEVWAIEPDPVWVTRTAAAVRERGLADRVRVIRTDVRHLRLPDRPFRVAANPPFGLTTEILALLLDRPERGPFRADLLLQREVARKHAATPPSALRTAAWAPWWEFHLGPVIGREAFRPRPAVDTQVLRITRRDPSILPPRLAPGLRDALRAIWDPADRPTT